jgi:hypothetical protein
MDAQLRLRYAMLVIVVPPNVTLVEVPNYRTAGLISRQEAA